MYTNIRVIYSKALKSYLQTALPKAAKAIPAYALVTDKVARH